MKNYKKSKNSGLFPEMKIKPPLLSINLTEGKNERMNTDRYALNENNKNVKPFEQKFYNIANP
jgi:hypothetical protein